MRLPAPWALQLDDELSSFDFVYEIREPPVTSGASHLCLENARHRLPLSSARGFRKTGLATVVSGSSLFQSIEGWIYLYRSIEIAKSLSPRATEGIEIMLDFLAISG
jgi:hypothetical protein